MSYVKLLTFTLPPRKNEGGQDVVKTFKRSVPCTASTIDRPNIQQPKLERRKRRKKALICRSGSNPCNLFLNEQALTLPSRKEYSILSPMFHWKPFNRRYASKSKGESNFEALFQIGRTVHFVRYFPSTCGQEQNMCRTPVTYVFGLIINHNFIFVSLYAVDFRCCFVLK